MNSTLLVIILYCTNITSGHDHTLRQKCMQELIPCIYNSDETIYRETSTKICIENKLKKETDNDNKKSDN